MTLQAVSFRERGSDRARGGSCSAPASAQQAAAVAIDSDDIGGVVTGPNGPEAGVWVIAETTDLPTRYIKSVVTDDQGRYLIPDLPKANYEVFVRGYGLVDSAKVQERAGQDRQLHRHGARRPKAAAEIYPAIYWYSMLKMPAKHEFPLGNVKSQAEWLNVVEDQRLLRLPRARQQGDAHDPVGVRRHEAGRRLGAAHPVRPGDEQHGDLDRPPRHAARAQALRRLDRPHRGRRTAGREAAAPAGHASATSSSRSGISPIPSTTCTTSPRPTSASRRSTPTA